MPVPIRPRWGDYGAAAVDGNSVWIASEYIGGACNYTDWGGPSYNYPCYATNLVKRISVDHCLFYDGSYRLPQFTYDYSGSSG